MTPYYPVRKAVKLPEGFDTLFYPPNLQTVPNRAAIIRANQYMVAVSYTHLDVYKRQACAKLNLLIGLYRTKD